MIGDVVCDSSVIVSLLLQDEVGEWLAGELDGVAIHAPDLVMYEAANVIRRHQLSGAVSKDHAELAFWDLFDLPIGLFPFESVAARAWELRENVTMYDAPYVALAEMIDTTLVTLDKKLAGASGIRCEVVTPPL